MLDPVPCFEIKHDASKSENFPRTYWVMIQGPDAADYLHRMSTVQVHALEIGQARLGFLLNPQGRIKSTFYLARLESRATGPSPGSGEDCFLIAVPSDAQGSRSTLEKFLAEIDLFKFAESFSIQELLGDTPQIVRLGPIPEATTVSEGRIDFFVQESLWHLPLQIIAAPQDVLDSLAKPEGTQSLHWNSPALEQLRIAQLSPALGHELLEDSSPLELGLAFGVAQGKGCYPGQEVIEKVISLGSPAKAIAQVQGIFARSAAPPVPSEIVDAESGMAAGVLTSAMGVSDTEWRGLAILRKNAAKTGQKLRLATDHYPTFTVQSLRKNE